jgi:hypothetical protein
LKKLGRELEELCREEVVEVVNLMAKLLRNFDAESETN